MYLKYEHVKAANMEFQYSREEKSNKKDNSAVTSAQILQIGKINKVKMHL